MQIIHRGHNAEQDIARYKTLEMLRKIKPEQFEMHTTLEDSDEMQPATECNTYGCIAGHCIIANLGVEVLHDGDYEGAEERSAKLMGLNSIEQIELFMPDTPDADYWCKDPNDSRHITQRRGILALWYFIKIGAVQWNNERLEKFVAKHPLPQMKGVAI